MASVIRDFYAYLKIKGGNNMEVFRKSNITRAYVKEHKNWLFLYGDNLMKQGYGGQAKEMRGEFNAKGIPTKKKPTMDEDAFFNDDMFEDIKKCYDDLFDINMAGFKAGKFQTWVVPSAGIGTGLAQLPTRAPKIYTYLLEKIKQLEEIE
jgi:hypothetical protein